MPKTNLFIISGPSGAGEDSVIEGLRDYFEIERVITTTTRSMRPGESQGHPYYFVAEDKFKEMIANDELAEYAEEYNNKFYGVTKHELERAKNSGKIGVWKIEYKGVMAMKKKFPEIKSIYIAPPDLETLKRRIKKRDNVSDKFIEERMEYTKEWMKHESIYDYKVVNEENKLSEAIKKVADIIHNDTIV